MSAKRARYNKIRSLADSLLRQFHVEQPPVPIKRILVGSGIEVKAGDLGEVSGLIARLGRSTIVGVNSTQPSVRQRFTMAHEFGHFLLHEGLRTHQDVNFRVNYRDRTSSEATDIDEIEANFFAACILMPRGLLDAADAADALDDDDAVRDLASLFHVSRHAMSLRLANEYGRFRPF